MRPSIIATVWTVMCLLLAPKSGFSQSINSLHWLEGAWRHVHTPDTVRSGETWTIVSPTEMAGTGYEIHYSDTVFVESIRIVIHNGVLQYIVDVAHNPNPIAFILANSDENKWVFVNSEHDFPNSIAYIREGPVRMTCIIAGGGKSRAFHFERSD